MPRTLVLANRSDCDAGLVGERLLEHDHELVVAPRESTAPLPDPRTFDLVLHLGSDWSVYDPARTTAVERERAFARAAVDAEVPVLGICFGAQLLASALGGSVARGPRVELGWLPIEPRDSHEVSGPVLEPGPWFQWHGDVFEPPPDAVVLATSDVGCQAFAAGSALAVQFHPEVTPGIVARWAGNDPGPLAAAGVETEAVVARTDAEQRRVRSATARLVDRFLYGGTTTATPPRSR